MLSSIKMQVRVIFIWSGNCLGFFKWISSGNPGHWILDRVPDFTSNISWLCFEPIAFSCEGTLLAAWHCRNDLVNKYCHILTCFSMIDRHWFDFLGACFSIATYSKWWLLEVRILTYWFLVWPPITRSVTQVTWVTW